MASNHDVGRFATRWCGNDERKTRLALLVLATLPGTTVLYYGDEIAMTDVAVPPGLRRDRFTLASESPAGSRDRGRTPMQWDATPAGGFTSAQVRPWLPIGDSAARNVAAQRGDPGSTLSFCRRLLAVRHAAFAGRLAAYERLPSAPQGWNYRAGDLTVLANFSDRLMLAADRAGEVLLTSYGPEPPAGDLVLQPWQGIIARLGAAAGSGLDATAGSP